MSEELEERLRLIRRNGLLTADKPRKASSLHPVCQEAADTVQRYREALEYYAMFHPQPDEGPWGVDSTDFGERARQALESKP